MPDFQIKFHQDLRLEDWGKLNIFEIMGNIGSEVSRTIKWKEKGKDNMWKAAFDRSLELFDLSKELNTLPLSQKIELLRAREIWCDFIIGDNQYKTTIKNIQKYFDDFAIAANNKPSLLGKSEKSE